MARGFSAQTRSLLSNAMQSETSADLSSSMVLGDAPMTDAGDSCITVGVAAGGAPPHPPTRGSSTNRVLSRTQSEVSTELQGRRPSELQLSLMEQQSRRQLEPRQSFPEQQIRRLLVSGHRPLFGSAASSPPSADNRVAAASCSDDAGGHAGDFLSGAGRGWGWGCGSEVPRLVCWVVTHILRRPSLRAWYLGLAWMGGMTSDLEAVVHNGPLRQ